MPIAHTLLAANAWLFCQDASMAKQYVWRRLRTSTNHFVARCRVFIGEFEGWFRWEGGFPLWWLVLQAVC